MFVLYSCKVSSNLRHKENSYNFSSHSCFSRHFKEGWGEMAVAIRCLVKIVLMVLFRRIKVFQWQQLHSQGLLQCLLPPDKHLLDNSSVRRIGIINTRSIACALVLALLVKAQGVDSTEKHFNQERKGHHLFIKGNANRLGMAGSVCINLLIRRILRMAIGISHLCGQHARYQFKVFLCSPKTSCCKIDFLFHATKLQKNLPATPWYVQNLCYLCRNQQSTKQKGMKLILLSNSNFFVEEDKILTTLFEEGLDILHIRKPNSEPVFCERLLTLIPDEYHKRIVVNDHFYLKEEFNLMGIHLSHHNPTAPKDYTDQVSRTAYSLEEVKELKPQSKYIILKNVRNSISEPKYVAQYTDEQLHDAVRQGIIDRHVMAQGGITLDNIAEIMDIGFGGVVVRGDLWKRFNIHQGCDFKDLIAHFRKLRRATS